MKRSLRLLFALLAVFALIAASCGDSDDDGGGDAEATTETTAAPADGEEDTTETTAAPADGEEDTTATTAAAPAGGEGFQVCQVSDTGGIDDKSFNETAWNGALQAQDELGVEAQFLESQGVEDFAPNIQSFLDLGCNLVVTVGFLLGDDTQASAEANPDQQYAIVDFAYDPAIPNVRGLTFQTDEAAFLAGYLAAGMTQTGVVGTFGGVNIPTVTIFMDGFRNGVLYHNQEKGTDVQVLGWDGSDGLFTQNFESLDDGRAFGQNLIDEGADIILPVAGPVGLGTAAVAQETGNVSLIGVDADQFFAAPEFADVWLTSIQKNMDVAVFDTVTAVLETGVIPDTLYSGTLENNGVGISPYHDFEDAVPAELAAEVEALQQAIIDGSVSVSG